MLYVCLYRRKLGFVHEFGALWIEIGRESHLCERAQMLLVVLLGGKGERKQIFPARGIRELYCTYSSRLV